MAATKNATNAAAGGDLLTPKTTEKQEVSTRKKQTVNDFLKSYEGQFKKALPTAMSAERFTRIALTEITRNPELKKCTPASLIGALLTSAQLGLEPGGPLGQAYLIPYKDRKRGVEEVQFQLGYKGMLELAHRSGEIKSIEAHCVYEHDEFEFEYGLEPKLKHIPAKKDRGDVAWVYAVYHLKNGGYGFEVMSKDDVEAHRAKFSKGYSPAWDKSWESMAKKTVLKQVLKYAPLSTETATAIATDESTMNMQQVDGDVELVQADYSVEEDEHEEEEEE